jgi:hypothetical protein
LVVGDMPAGHEGIDRLDAVVARVVGHAR